MTTNPSHIHSAAAVCNVWPSSATAPATAAGFNLLYEHSCQTANRGLMHPMQSDGQQAGEPRIAEGSNSPSRGGMGVLRCSAVRQPVARPPFDSNGNCYRADNWRRDAPTQMQHAGAAHQSSIQPGCWHQEESLSLPLDTLSPAFNLDPVYGCGGLPIDPNWVKNNSAPLATMTGYNSQLLGQAMQHLKRSQDGATNPALLNTRAYQSMNGNLSPGLASVDEVPAGLVLPMGQQQQQAAHSLEQQQQQQQQQQAMLIWLQQNLEHCSMDLLSQQSSIDTANVMWMAGSMSHAPVSIAGSERSSDHSAPCPELASLGLNCRPVTLPHMQQQQQHRPGFQAYSNGEEMPAAQLWAHQEEDYGWQAINPLQQLQQLQQQQRQQLLQQQLQQQQQLAVDWKKLFGGAMGLQQDVRSQAVALQQQQQGGYVNVSSNQAVNVQRQPALHPVWPQQQVRYNNLSVAAMLQDMAAVQQHPDPSAQIAALPMSRQLSQEPSLAMTRARQGNHQQAQPSHQQMDMLYAAHMAAMSFGSLSSPRVHGDAAAHRSNVLMAGGQWAGLQCQAMHQDLLPHASFSGSQLEMPHNPAPLPTFMCDICAVQCNSAINLQEHIGSKRHMAKVARNLNADGAGFEACRDINLNAGLNKPGCPSPIVVNSLCRQLLTSDINAVVTSMLLSVKGLQDSDVIRNGAKTPLHRRYVCGLREVRKAVNMQRAISVVVAPNIQLVDAADGPNCLLKDIVDKCGELGLPFVFALTRKSLGQVYGCHKRVSAVAMLDTQGVEGLHDSLVGLVKEACAGWKEHSFQGDGPPLQVLDEVEEEEGGLDAGDVVSIGVKTS